MEKTTFSDFERQAMKDRAQELANQAKNKKDAKYGEASVLLKISEMTDTEANIANALHQLVKTIAPQLKPKTWYSMPAYANENDKVVIFFQPASRFKVRYSTIGFQDAAHLDQGDFWPTSYAIQAMTPAIKEELIILIRRAIN
ncbi:hypothetical protein [Convivina intestini]|uniref:hypothetical protein n=1 Tax=Convivina intestini TaxID=1505726 RepID=UPI0020109E47|nr:hypothetical protein [Convivina intestini]CAH1853257.1 hypothetical protein R078131_00695 [Convivina intestini]